MWSTVYAENVQGFGYKALQFATIDSMDHSTLNVKMYGYMAGHGATMICRSGSKCELKCESSGCFKMELNCLSDSFCTVTPNECMEDNSVEKIDGIDCPIWKTSKSLKNDGKLIKHIEKKHKYHNTLFKLQSYNRQHINHENYEFGAMVMENEIVPRHYHRLYLYLAIVVSVIFMFTIPGCCYLNNRLFGDKGKTILLTKAYSI